MTEKWRIALLVGIMIVVLAVVGVVSMTMLYRASLEEQKERLSEIARSAAVHFEEAARMEAVPADGSAGTIDDAAMHDLIELHTHYLTRTKTGEIVVARLRGDTIVFLLRRTPFVGSGPDTLRFDSVLAAPMRRALSGMSGTMTGTDYRGATVLAAYEPVPALGLGVVVKIDLAEIKAPFIRAGTTAGIVAILLALAGSFAFLRVSAPIIRHIGESEERFRMLVESAPEAIFVQTDKRFAYVNPAAVTLYGASSAGQLLGKPVMDRFHPDYHKLVAERIKSLNIDRKAQPNVEQRHVKLDGTIVDVSVSGTPVRYGEKDGALIFVRDISERKRAEAALRESEARLRLAYNAAKAGAWEWDLTTNKNTWSDELWNLYGLEPGSVEPSYDLWKQSIHPGDRAAVETAVQKAAGNGTQLYAEWRVNNPTGPERWLMSRGQPQRDEKGQVVSYLGVVVDITERKRDQEAIEVLSRRQEAILDAVADIIMEVDANKTYTWSNHAGYDFFGDDVVGKEAAFYFEGEQDTYAAVQPLFNGSEDIFYVESWQRRKDGEKRLLGWWCRALKDDEGNVTGALSSARDVTDRRAAEEQVRKSAAFLDSIIDQSPVPTWISDEKGTLIRINQACCDLLHISPQDVMGKYNVLTDNIVIEQGHVSKVRAVFKKGETARFEIRYDTAKVTGLNLNGTASVYLDVTIFPVRNPAGKITNAVIQHKDITERKQAEEALRQSEEKYRTVADYNYDWEYWVGVDGGLIYMSPACERITGYRAEEFMKNPGLLQSIIHPDEREEHARHEAERDSKQTGQLDYRIITRSGQQRWIAHACLTVFGEDGSPLGRRASNRDITDRKEAEQSILIRNRISDVFLTVPDQEMYNDVLGVVLGVMESKYGVFGYIDENGALVVPTMTRQVWAKCEVPEKDIIFPRETWGHSSWPRAIREKKPNHSNAPSINLPEGHVAIIRHITVPILFHDEVIGLFQVANKQSDYTEEDLLALTAIADQVAPILDARLHHERAEMGLRTLNEELEQRVIDRTERLQAANKELEAFSYSVSHDLRTPLRAIDGFTRVLVEEYEQTLDEEGKRLTGVIRDNTQRMGKLIDDLLAFSRVGRSQMHIGPVDMALAARSVFFELTAEEDRAHIDFSVGTLPQADGDETMLRQVWTNLVSNAVKFSSKKERAIIEVTGRADGSETVYSIKDNGAGFDMQYADKLFGVFQRLHGEKEFPGTGVGLAIVQRVVARHGGRVWAKGAVGQGAEFSFSLPRHGGES